MDNTEKLIELFKEFPGIGPRQAKRFVYFLLSKNQGYVNDISKIIKEIQSSVQICDKCFRFSTVDRSKTCKICRDDSRDKSTLMLVSHDIDFENIEKTRIYNGHYFILGGTIPILGKNPERRIRQTDLLDQIQNRIKDGLKEIIIALNYNPEGENTLSYLKELLLKGLFDSKVKISTLGRGLSTGTELEYSDSETIKNALKNRQ